MPDTSKSISETSNLCATLQTHLDKLKISTEKYDENNKSVDNWQRGHRVILELKAAYNALYRHASDADREGAVKEKRATRKEKATKIEEPAYEDTDAP